MTSGRFNQQRQSTYRNYFKQLIIEGIPNKRALNINI